MSSGRLRLTFFIAAALLGVSLFLSLGAWQVQRRHWKIDLIEQVEQRRNAPPVAAPGPDQWSTVTSQNDAYRRVRVHGLFLHDHETLVQASTSYGTGFWVMTPLRTDQGFTILVNRGFVSPEHRDPATRAEGQIAGEVTIIGLMRMTEPKGSFLRANDATSGHWYSRDVAAIAASQKLRDSAPYFIDADSTPYPGGWPIGGLTVIAFPNNHLIYAITWFGLAFLLAIASFVFLREEYRLSRNSVND